MKKNGIALISTIMIVSILVMIMVSMVFILTNSTYMTGRYIDDNIAIQVAEAGVAYAIRQLNANPSWRGDVLDESGIYRQTDIYLPDIKGKFYITFNPSKDYCSCNNLKKNQPTTRNSIPYGIIPPYTGEIIIKGEVNKKVKYIKAVMVRGDFMNSHLSAEGPVVIKNAISYEDSGISDDKKGLIITNADGNSVYIPSPISVNLHGGKVVSCGIAYVPELEPNDSIINNSVKEDFGKIMIDKIMNRCPKSSPDVKILTPGNYKVTRTLNNDGIYSYSMLYNGTPYDCSSWAEFDPWGNLIIKESVYVPQNGTNPITIQFDYTNETYILNTGYKEPGHWRTPLLARLLSIPCAYGAVGENRPPVGENRPPGDETPDPDPPATLMPPTPTRVPIGTSLPTNTPEPTNTPVGSGTPVPTSTAIEVPTPTQTPLSVSLAPKIIFDVGNNGKRTTIYSETDVELLGRVSGIGAVVTRGKTGIIGSNDQSSSVAIISGKDLEVKANPYINTYCNGIYYSDDDIYFLESEHPVEASNTGEFIIGGFVFSNNINDDINPHNPDKSSIYFDLPYNKIKFVRALNYYHLDKISGYEFPVKLVSWQEIK